MTEANTINFPNATYCRSERDFHHQTEKNFSLFKLGEIRQSNFMKFPDIISEKNGKEIKIEIERSASNFLKHHHNINKVDYIICAEKDIALNKPIIEVKNVFFIPSFSDLIGELFGCNSGTTPWQHLILLSFKEKDFRVMQKKEIFNEINKKLNTISTISVSKKTKYLDDCHNPTRFHNDINYLIKNGFIIKAAHGAYKPNLELCKHYFAYIERRDKHV